MTYCPELSRLSDALLRSLRVLIWTALVASAPAQLLPPKPEFAPAAELELALAPRHHTATPHTSTGLTRGVFRYLGSTEWAPLQPHNAELPSLTSTDAPPDAPLIINNGQVIKLHQNLRQPLGIGTGKIAWAGSGGFAAYGKDRIVQISGDVIIWGVTEHFIGASDVLMFGASDADATVLWGKIIDLGGGKRTIQVINSFMKGHPAAVRFDQGFSNGDLLFYGDGRADFSASNDNWDGTLSVRQAEVRLNLNGKLGNLSELNIDQSGRFIIDNLGSNSSSSGGRYMDNRLGKYTAINLDSGTFAYWGRDRGDSTGRAGKVTLIGGANVIDITNHRPDQSTLFTISGLYRNNNATLNLINSRTDGGTFGTGGHSPQLRFRISARPEDIPTLEGGIIPWATVNGTHFATLKGQHLVAYTDYHTGNAHEWNATTNASPTADQYLSTDHTVNSLRLDGDRKITLYANAKLTLNSGALLSTGPKHAINNITGGELVIGGTGPRSLYVHAYGAWMSISSDIRQSLNGAPISLIKTGESALTLTGHDLSGLTGTHHIHEGSLWIYRDGPGTGIGGHIIIGNKNLNFATLLLGGSRPLQRNTRITLRGITQKLPQHGAGFRTSTSTLYLSNQEQIYLDSLNIDGSGILIFGGSGRHHFIAFDHITMTDSSSEFFIQGWTESQSHLLISRAAGDEIAKYLGQIKFTDYHQPLRDAQLIDYDADYLEIIPIGVPEPATTGAILGASALGFFAWRRHLKRNN